MVFADNMYFGYFAGKEKTRIKSEFRRHKSGIGVYAIALSEKEADILEIIPAWELNSKTYRKYHEDNLMVVGMAVTKAEALALAEKILMDIYNKADIFDAKKYFVFRRKEK